MAEMAPDGQPAPPGQEQGHEHLFLIPQLVGLLRWVEELIVALSGYGIVFALAVGVVDLLTDGQLSQQWAWVDMAYAVAFAAAIAGQIIGLSSRSARAFSQGHAVRGVAYTLLVLLLAYTEYQATVVFGFHRAFGVPVALSLAQLGINQAQFIQLRAVVGVFLAVLSGYLRWQPQKAKSIAQLQQEADYKRQADAIKAQQRADGLRNLTGLVGQAGQAARNAVVQATQRGASSAGTSAEPSVPVASAPDGPSEPSSQNGQSEAPSSDFS